jgi:hypothetical protein
LDLFKPVVRPESLNATLRTLTRERGHTPALGLLRELMHYFQDLGGDFVEQFQSTGFDARLWELYLYALSQSSGEPHDVARCSSMHSGLWQNPLI